MSSSLHSTYLEVNLSQLKRNWQIVSKEMAPAQVMAVMKTHGYGHGFDLMARCWSSCGAKYLGVDHPEEGIKLRSVGYKGRILVMGLTVVEHLKTLSDYDLEFCLASPEVLKAWLALEAPPLAYLKCDTGLSRQGFREEELLGVMQSLKASGFSSQVLGLMSHCSHQMSPGDPRGSIEKQQKRMEFWRSQGRALGLNTFTHMASSSSAVLVPATRYDLVRIGGLLYGEFSYPLVRKIWFSQASSQSHRQHLKPALGWKSSLGQIKVLKKGDRVGYDGEFEASEDGTVVATLPVGYSHGYSRATGRHPQSHVLVGKEKCLVVGAVSMAMMSVLLPRKEGFYVGQEVVLLGKSGDRQITLEEFASWGDRVPYEVLVALSSDIPRIAVD